MYSFYRLKKCDQDYAFSFNGTARARTNAMSFAIASVLVNKISFIKEPEKKHFDPTHINELTERFSSINDVLRIDLDAIFGYAEKLYRYRMSYLAAQETPNPVTSPETAVIDCFGISRHFSKDDLNMIKENGAQIAIDMLKLHSLFMALNFFPDEIKPSSETSVALEVPG